VEAHSGQWVVWSKRVVPEVAAERAEKGLIGRKATKNPREEHRKPMPLISMILIETKLQWHYRHTPNTRPWLKGPGESRTTHGHERPPSSPPSPISRFLTPRFFRSGDGGGGGTPCAACRPGAVKAAQELGRDGILHRWPLVDSPGNDFSTLFLRMEQLVHLV